MKLPSTRRSLALAAALALSLAATGWIAAQESAGNASPEVAAAVTRPRAPAAAASDPDRRAGDPAEIRLQDLRRDEGEPEAKELFAARSWQAPPEAAANPPPPPPPTAPALPFAYLGKMFYDGALTVFLSYQDHSYAVKAGDTVAGNYRVDSIQGPVLTLTYLPLDIQQTMHIGDQN